MLSQTKQRHLSRMSEGYEGNVATLIDRLRSSWRIIVALRGAMRYKTQHSQIALRAAHRICQVPKPAIDRFRLFSTGAGLSSQILD